MMGGTGERGVSGCTCVPSNNSASPLNRQNKAHMGKAGKWL
jgi:hypothetical protein